MRKNFNTNQLVIPFDEAIWHIDVQKRNRDLELQNKTTYFSLRKNQRDFLIKITYDITDKDFEYLCCYILEKEYNLKFKVKGGNNDKGEDIFAFDGKIKYSVQCKQWSNLFIPLKKAGEYFGQTYGIRKENPNTRFVYMTTSYLSPDAEDFMKYYGIKTINNIQLISLCEKYNLLNQEEWENAIGIIKNRRVKEGTPLEKLKIERLRELTHHLPKYMHPENVKISGIPIDINHPFFQFWN